MFHQEHLLTIKITSEKKSGDKSQLKTNKTLFKSQDENNIQDAFQNEKYNNV